MKWKLERPLFAAVFVLLAGSICLTGGAVSAVAPDTHPVIVARVPQGEAQRVTGKVAAATENALSLEVEQAGQARTIHFVINEDTNVEGELRAGANAEVSYRTEGGRNIATNIRVLA
jgi:hypothetical protein